MDYKELAKKSIAKQNYQDYYNYSLAQYKKSQLPEDKIEYEKSKKMLDLYKEVTNINKMNENDYYRILDVNINSDESEIKRQYMKLTMKYHPDKTKMPESNSAFAKIKKAYDVLSDKKLRRNYDGMRNESMRHNQFSSNVNGIHDFFDLNDYVRNMYGGYEPFGNTMNYEFQFINGFGQRMYRRNFNPRNRTRRDSNGYGIFLF
ncbi:hypothetical protein COBT_003525, partial [Conglomerata obtusa]